MSFKKDLSPLLSPKTIAVIGASEKFGAGSLVIDNLRTLGFSGDIIPVNPGLYGSAGNAQMLSLVVGYPARKWSIDCAAVVVGQGRTFYRY